MLVGIGFEISSTFVGSTVVDIGDATVSMVVFAVVEPSVVDDATVSMTVFVELSIVKNQNPSSSAAHPIIPKRTNKYFNQFTVDCREI